MYRSFQITLAIVVSMAIVPCGNAALILNDGAVYAGRSIENERQSVQTSSDVIENNLDAALPTAVDSATKTLNQNQSVAVSAPNAMLIFLIGLGLIYFFRTVNFSEVSEQEAPSDIDNTK